LPKVKFLPPLGEYRGAYNTFTWIVGGGNMEVTEDNVTDIAAQLKVPENKVWEFWERLQSERSKTKLSAVTEEQRKAIAQKEGAERLQAATKCRDQAKAEYGKAETNDDRKRWREMAESMNAGVIHLGGEWVKLEES
jgi:hypothetical protein